MMELFILGCAGVVVLLHSANFFFHALSRKIGFRSLSHFNNFIDFIFCLSVWICDFVFAASLDSLGEWGINGLGASNMLE
ncbi:hypothetical protein MA16_Dca017510 [Dendrobium catenatum]|uniref:Uncharacterized protein n=1 Tax=Dendrobium catenatum TaxID=906689 RepID=A0A2I0VAD1_9ASPA|nr:hypothetical protein MA16_Dca028641 [Dendrobium catenatum]PKU82288.1 hypothetical protein MA16_Dca017510 [Dendrobium catenatum]